MSVEFGRRLADLLERSRMTQRDLAAITGLTEAAVSRYVSGAREPRAITVARIAEALDVTPQELLGTTTNDEVDGAVRLIARNASFLTEEQRKELITALAKR
ncbi:MAG: helix-turn-helix transcriptional regulator [Coriobacteriales bacterium]|nr:helix-turn-helix transcriptional regulator [Coriobacteriales bacterium]